jgi:hypothetical protein
MSTASQIKRLKRLEEEEKKMILNEKKKKEQIEKDEIIENEAKAARVEVGGNSDIIRIRPKYWGCIMCRNRKNSNRIDKCQTCNHPRQCDKFVLKNHDNGKFYLCKADTSNLIPSISFYSMSDSMEDRIFNSSHTNRKVILPQVSNNLKECAQEALINTLCPVITEDLFEKINYAFNGEINDHGTKLSRNDSNLSLFQQVMENATKMIYDARTGRFVDLNIANAENKENGKEIISCHSSYNNKMKYMQHEIAHIVDQTVKKRADDNSILYEFEPPSRDEERRNCSLCDYEFPISQFVGNIPFRAIVKWREERNDPVSLNDHRTDLTRIHNASPLCTFCIQFFDSSHSEKTDENNIRESVGYGKESSMNKQKNFSNSAYKRVMRQRINKEKKIEDRPLSRIKQKVAVEHLKFKNESYDPDKRFLYNNHSSAHMLDQERSGKFLRHKYHDQGVVLTAIRKGKKEEMEFLKRELERRVEILSVANNVSPSKKNQPIDKNKRRAGIFIQDVILDSSRTKTKSNSNSDSSDDDNNNSNKIKKKDKAKEKELSSYINQKKIKIKPDVMYDAKEIALNKFNSKKNRKERKENDKRKTINKSKSSVGDSQSLISKSSKKNGKKKKKIRIPVKEENSGSGSGSDSDMNNNSLFITQDNNNSPKKKKNINVNVSLPPIPIMTKHNSLPVIDDNRSKSSEIRPPVLKKERKPLILFVADKESKTGKKRIEIPKINTKTNESLETRFISSADSPISRNSKFDGPLRSPKMKSKPIVKEFLRDENPIEIINNNENKSIESKENDVDDNNCDKYIKTTSKSKKKKKMSFVDNDFSNSHIELIDKDKNNIVQSEKIKSKKILNKKNIDIQLDKSEIYESDFEIENEVVENLNFKKSGNIEDYDNINLGSTCSTWGDISGGEEELDDNNVIYDDNEEVDEDNKDNKKSVLMFGGNKVVVNVEGQGEFDQDEDMGTMDSYDWATGDVIAEQNIRGDIYSPYKKSSGGNLFMNSRVSSNHSKRSLSRTGSNSSLLLSRGEHKGISSRGSSKGRNTPKMRSRVGEEISVSHMHVISTGGQKKLNTIKLQQKNKNENINKENEIKKKSSLIIMRTESEIKEAEQLKIKKKKDLQKLKHQNHKSHPLLANHHKDDYKTRRENPELVF